MDQSKLRELLESVQRGVLPVEGALEELKSLPFVELGYATVDHHRAIRQGVPEVIFGQGKAPEHIVGIARELMRKGQNVLITRLDATAAAHVTAEIPEIRYMPIARIATFEQAPIPDLGTATLISAGTSDLPVAEECAETMRMLGIQVERIVDVGVAGLHRLLSKRKAIEEANLIVVVAGMEGALPSVVGGLASAPIISVPTSVGYGASFQGLSALLCMLTSCASGITVVNIDNGFGAAFAAARILRRQGKKD
jgi:NCAIR mutase (PurE)-related protein